LVTDTQMKDRVKVVLNGSSPDGRTTEHPLVAIQPDQALQVLAMAQRTAEEHIGSAHRHADSIRADALAAAEQIAREAEAHATNVRRGADKALIDAKATTEQAGRDAQAQVEQARRNAEKIVADARAEAMTITAGARSDAHELKAQAKRRYEDIVGSLGAKRMALQEQIEALELFDREYRGRLTAFMQSQMRALWMDQPQVDGEFPGDADPRPSANRRQLPAHRQATESQAHIAAPTSGGPMPPAHRHPAEAGEQGADQVAEQTAEAEQQVRQDAAPAEHRAREAAEAGAQQRA
jgi:vacuolar-type H+-ATPase subunit H